MTGILLAVALALAANPSPSTSSERGSSTERSGMERNERMENKQAVNLNFDKDQVAQVIKGWNTESRDVAQALLDKYGTPDGVTKDAVIWNGEGKWHQIIVSNVAYDQNFPTPHKNVLMEFVSYKMPVDKIDDVARFNGSVVYDRTAGMLGVSGPNEAMNYLTVNVVDDIVNGKMDVDAARSFYANTAKSYTAGLHNDYTDGFRFNIPGNAADPDKAFTEARPGRAGTR